MRLLSTSALSQGLQRPRPLSSAARRGARAALGHAFADARRMPGNLLAYERLDELTAAARRIVAEVERLPEGPYAFTGLAGPDAYAVEHAIDATVIGLLVGRREGLGSDSLRQLGLGLFLRDIGKLALPPAIVHKPGPLDADEWELMKRHPLRGLEFLRDEAIGSRARAVVRSHHERWDGDGYPNGLAGEQIPRSARIGGLADAFTAMTSERHHAPAASQEDALAAVREEASSAFDPRLVAILGELVEAPRGAPCAAV